MTVSLNTCLLPTYSAISSVLGVKGFVANAVGPPLSLTVTTWVHTGRSMFLIPDASTCTPCHTRAALWQCPTGGERTLTRVLDVGSQRFPSMSKLRSLIGTAGVIMPLLAVTRSSYFRWFFHLPRKALELELLSWRALLGPMGAKTQGPSGKEKSTLIIQTPGTASHTCEQRLLRDVEENLGLRRTLSCELARHLHLYGGFAHGRCFP